MTPTHGTEKKNEKFYSRVTFQGGSPFRSGRRRKDALTGCSVLARKMEKRRCKTKCEMNKEGKESQISIEKTLCSEGIFSPRGLSMSKKRSGLELARAKWVETVTGLKR